jgi:hypothetical protein
MAQELLRHQPTDGSRKGWLARITNSSPSYMKDSTYTTVLDQTPTILDREQ